MTPAQRRDLIERMAAHPRASIRAQAERMRAESSTIDGLLIYADDLHRGGLSNHGLSLVQSSPR